MVHYRSWVNPRFHLHPDERVPEKRKTYGWLERKSFDRIMDSRIIFER
jgi:hypothetical protein